MRELARRACVRGLRMFDYCWSSRVDVFGDSKDVYAMSYRSGPMLERCNDGQVE